MQSYSERRRTRRAVKVDDISDVTELDGVAELPNGSALYPAVGGAYLPVKIGDYLEEVDEGVYNSVPAEDFEAEWEAVGGE